MTKLPILLIWVIELVCLQSSIRNNNKNAAYVKQGGHRDR